MILYRLRKFLNKKRKTRDCLWRAAKAGAEGKVHYAGRPAAKLYGAMLIGG